MYCDQQARKASKEYQWTREMSWSDGRYLHWWVLTQVSPVKHVKHPAWSPNHYVGGLGRQLLHLVADIGAPNAGVAGSPHVVSQSQNHLLDLKRVKMFNGDLLLASMHYIDLRVSWVISIEMCHHYQVCPERWNAIISLATENNWNPLKVVRKKLLVWKLTYAYIDGLLQWELLN